MSRRRNAGASANNRCRFAGNVFSWRVGSIEDGNMITRRALLLSGGASLGAATLSSSLPAQDRPTLRFVLDWKYEGEHAQFTLPLTDGTFQRLGLNVAMDRGNGSGDTIAKVASGAYDMGLADTYAMVRFNAANPANRLISVAMVQDASAVG